MLRAYVADGCLSSLDLVAGKRSVGVGWDDEDRVGPVSAV
jgi:hypothetical protein